MNNLNTAADRIKQAGALVELLIGASGANLALLCLANALRAAGAALDAYDGMPSTARTAA